MEHEFTVDPKIHFGAEVEAEKEVTPIDRLQAECERAIQGIGQAVIMTVSVRGELPDDYEILGLRTRASLWDNKPGARLFVEEITRLISGVAATVRKLNIEAVQTRPAPDKREEYGKDARIIRFKFMDEWQLVLSASIEQYEGDAETGKGKSILGCWLGVLEDRLQ